MATTKPAPPEPCAPGGPCACTHPLHVPRRPGLGPVGHGLESEVGTRQNVETPAGVVALCAVCRAANHMREEA